MPPTHSPLRLDAEILSLIRSEVTSRSLGKRQQHVERQPAHRGGGVELLGSKGPAKAARHVAADLRSALCGVGPDRAQVIRALGRGNPGAASKCARVGNSHREAQTSGVPSCRRVLAMEDHRSRRRDRCAVRDRCSELRRFYGCSKAHF